MVVEIIYTKEQIRERARKSLENIKKSALIHNEKYVWKGELEAFGMSQAMQRQPDRAEAK